MKTIIEADRIITKLWPDQSIKDHVKYRLMRYVLRTDYKNHVLLHNNVTGELVVLDHREKNLLDHLPLGCFRNNDLAEHLVNDHFLVPEDFDESNQVDGMRVALQKYSNGRSGFIYQYTILPTTSCNARCYYCFEQGAQKVTMSEQVVKDTIEFITAHRDPQREISILWFGGEPTVAETIIDQICLGLANNHVLYYSSMISNGFLFDKEMANKAKTLWNLKHVQISVDGTEQNYNSIKSYTMTHENPYQRVLRNIELLLDQGISVGLRMNFDIDNYLDFGQLLTEMADRFKNNNLLRVSAYPVIGEHANKEGFINHGSDEWFEDKYAELNLLAKEAGLLRKDHRLPKLNYSGCGAAKTSAVTITASGFLVRCPEQFDKEQATGNLKKGEIEENRLREWRKLGNYLKCKDCIFFPSCFRLEKCAAKDRCFVYKMYLLQYRSTIEEKCDLMFKNRKKEELYNDL